MNMHLVKRIGLYLLGAGIGAGIAALLVNHFLPELYEEAILPDGDVVLVKRDDFESAEEIGTRMVYETDNGPAEATITEKKEKKKGVKPPEKSNEEDYTKFSKTSHKNKTVTQVAREMGVIPTPFGLEAQDKPHVISLINYLDPSNSYPQVVLTYYEDDDTLCDSQEKPIPNPEELLGDGLHNFGLGSDDPDIVYVRNDKLTINYEVVRIHGKYSVIVAGIPEESKANARSRPRHRGHTQKVNNIHDDDDEEA